MTTQPTRWGQQGLADRVGVAVYDFGVQHGWIARPFGQLMWGTDTAMFFASIDALGELPDGAAVLDIPCGGGVALRGLRADQRVRYVAADLSPDMLARARRRAAGLGRTDVEFHLANIEAMPFGDAEFDLCVSFNGLHCLPDPAAAVREIARCLKPGGHLVGDTVVRGAGWRQDLMIDILGRAGLFGVGGTLDELRSWLTDAGLTVAALQVSGAIVHFRATR